ncbi:hypothetical protein ABW21_db0206213 [Orbilia brochopaga]|nr:hypothetical protein ABW21_db0206213 [Drechslerella brochopaga]
MVTITVAIYSSGAVYGPLQPPATLRYDLRKVANPPKQLRDTLDGRSKKLRNHLTNDKGFMQLLDTIHADILHEIGLLQVDKGETSDATQHLQHLQSPHDAQEHNDTADEGSSGAIDIGEEIARAAEHESDRKLTLTVNCFCHRGRHRSASMVEELARLRWPADIDVEVFHRDIDRSREKADRSKQRRAGKSLKMLQHDDEF